MTLDQMSLDRVTMDQWMASSVASIEAHLDKLLPATSQVPTQLLGAMRYAVLDGGKRIRPLLTLAAAQLVDADETTALSVGCAVELIHAYSLVHDDLPCMDNDLLRRGKPTVHVAFGEANAMLVGDGLQALAFGVLANLNHSGGPDALTPQAVIELIKELAQASGCAGMVGGQAIDCAVVGSVLSRTDLEQMHGMKTGALLRASVMMGARCGIPRPSVAVLTALDQYSRAIGLAFQVVDDILDVKGDTVTLGKTAGKDAQQNKPTFVSLMGLVQAQHLADTLFNQAILVLEPFAQRAQRLRELAQKIVSRKS